jgi:hypothetical protein
MTISTTQSSSGPLGGNGLTTAFTFNFVADSAADISVIYTNASGINTTLNPSQYALTINPAGSNQLWGIGGVVTYPLTGSPIATGTYLTINRILPLTQKTSVQNQGNYYAQVTEQALDTLCMEIQQVSAAQPRAIQIPITDPTTINTILPAASARANMVLSFDNLGNVITSAPTGYTPTPTNLSNYTAQATGGNTQLTLATRFNDYLYLDDFGGIGDNATDNTSAFNTAIAYLNNSANGGRIFIPHGSFVVNTALNSLTGTGCEFWGAGAGNGSNLSSTPIGHPYGSIIRSNFASGNLFTFNGAERCGIRDASFWPVAYRTSGYEIYGLGNVFWLILDRLKFSFCNIPINIATSTESVVRDCHFLNNFGGADVLVGATINGGSTGLGAQATNIINPIMQMAWQGAIPAVSGTGKVWTAWTQSASRSLYDIQVVNGYIFQCTQGGITNNAGSGPTVPVYTAASGAGSPLQTTIIDGTVHWVMLTSSSHAGVLVDSFSVQTVIDNAQLESGFYGMRMTDSAAVSLSKPSYTTLIKCLANNTVGAGYAFDGGWIAELDDCVANFSASSAGLTTGAAANFGGELSIIGGRYSQNATQGIAFNGSGVQNLKVHGARIGGNSQLLAGNYDDLVVNGAITNFDIQGNTFSVIDSPNAVANAININSVSANNFIVMGNRLGGNSITNLAGTSSTRVVTFNV